MVKVNLVFVDVLQDVEHKEYDVWSQLVKLSLV